MNDLALPVRLGADTDRVLILANPKAGAGSGKARVERLIAALQRLRLKADLVPSLDEVTQCATRKAQASGRLRALVGAGGDGTIAELINRTPAGIPLAMLPLGTETLLAKYVDMPRSPEEVAEVIAAGTVVRHDAGIASGRLFFLMVSCGFDADVVRRLHENRDGHIRHWSYFKPIWQSIRSYDYPELRVYYATGEVGGSSPERISETLIRARFAFIFNIPRYAFGFQFAPQALGRRRLAGYLYVSPGWVRSWIVVFDECDSHGQHHRLADCSRARAKRIRIEADVPVPYNLDGDHCGYLPLEVEIVPDRLVFVVPPGWAERRRVAAVKPTI